VFIRYKRDGGYSLIKLTGKTEEAVADNIVFNGGFYGYIPAKQWIYIDSLSVDRQQS
jgi:oligoribonuclease NrnB/cAMP/cGMP phosphodiesterase (DHH superfamily)